MNDELVMWVVYDHPKDYPENFVARKFLIGHGEARASAEALVFVDLVPLRWVLQRAGLCCLARNPQDDPVIVESWI